MQAAQRSPGGVAKLTNRRVSWPLPGSRFHSFTQVMKERAELEKARTSLLFAHLPPLRVSVAGAEGMSFVAGSGLFTEMCPPLLASQMAPSVAAETYSEGKDARLKKLGGDFGAWKPSSCIKVA